MPPATDDVKVGSKVEVTGKDLRGVVAFCGLTSFAAGKWIGVVLDQPNGKNNGTVQGKTYFSCQDNYGLFVRPSQLTILEEAPPISTPQRQTKAAPPKTPSTGTKTPAAKLARPSAASSNISKSASQASLVSDTSASVAADAKGPSKDESKAADKTLAINKTEQGSSNEEINRMRVEVPQMTFSVDKDGDAGAENELLRAQVQDLTEKLNTLKVKRAEDREKLKDYGTIKMQASMLPEFKTKIAELQKELQNAQKKVEETTESCKAKLEEYQDIADTVEMLTLDKEMAEEKCDTLKYENESLILRVNELELDLKVIKEEIEVKGTDGVSSDYEYKQLEAQCNRQKEALLRLRELMADQNAQREELSKENKRLENLLTSVSAERDKLDSEKKSMEENMGNLRETVDAAFGSEKMIELLTAKNLELEDRCAQQEEFIQELEELTETNNEIEENFRQTELALREDIDMKEAELRALNTKAEHLTAVVNDSQNTILKFRHLVQQLREENESLKASVPTEAASNDSATKSGEDVHRMISPQSLSQPPSLASSFNVDLLKVKQSTTQNLMKGLECDLKDLEIKHLTENMNYIISYLPENFAKSAGDLDCIRASVLLPRLAEKIKVLIKYVKMRNGAGEDGGVSSSESHASGSSTENPCFALNVSVQLLSLHLLVSQVSFILNTCPVEKYLRVGSVFPEMMVHEKSIDNLINLFKKDQLDDTMRFENIVKARSFFEQLLKAVFHGQKQNTTDVFQNSLVIIQESAHCINTSCEKIASYLNPNSDFDDFLIYVRDTTQTSLDIKKACWKIKKQFSTSADKMLKVSDKHVQDVLENVDLIRSFALIMYQISRETEIAASVLNDGDFISSEKLCELRDQCMLDANKIYGTIKVVPSKIHTYVTELCTMVEEGEFEEVQIPKYQQPIYAHAEHTKAELANQTRTAEDADLKAAELKEIKIKLRQKDEELAGMSVKIDMLEQKSKTVPKATEEKMRMMKEECEKAKQELENSKRTHEITLQGLDQEIKELEQSNKDLKAKISSISMRGLMGSVSKYAVSATAPKEEGMGKMVDSPLLLEEIGSLRNALTFSQQEVWRLRGEKMKAQLDRLKPLKNLDKPIGLSSTNGLVKLDGGDKSTALGNLSRQASALVSELDRLCVSPRVVNVANRKAGNVPTVDKLSSAQQLVAMKTHHLKVQNKLETLREKVLNLTAVEYPIKDSNMANPQNSLFADRDELRRMKENLNPSLVAKIDLPVTKSSAPGNNKVFLSREQFFKLHHFILDSEATF